MLEHEGSCRRGCGHKLFRAETSLTPLSQRVFNTDPRVVSWRANENDSAEFVFSRRPVEEYYRVCANDADVWQLAW